MLSAVSQLNPEFILIYNVLALLGLLTIGYTQDLSLEGLSHGQVLVLEGRGTLKTMEATDGHMGHRV